MVDFRANCPIGSALDLLGDKWSLLLVRDMLIYHKTTFKEFQNSKEKIATNTLSSRLKWLSQNSIVEQHKLTNNKKTKIYLLTDAGIALAGPILELKLWSEKHVAKSHPEMNSYDLDGTSREVSDKLTKQYCDFKESTLKLCEPSDKRIRTGSI